MKLAASLIAACLVSFAQAQPKTAPPPAEPSQSAAKPETREDDLRRTEKPDVVKMLQKRVPEAEFADVPLERVFDWLAERTGAMVVVRWKTLEESGFSRDMPVTFNASGRRLWRVLWAMSNTVEGAPGERLAFEASGDSFIFSTHRDLTREMVTIAYDVSTLLHPDVDFALGKAQGYVCGERALHTRVKRATAPPPTASPGDRPHVQAPRPVVSIEHSDPAMMDLVELIFNTIEPDSWEINGMGGRATMFPFKRDRIVIRNSLYVHQLIGGFVKDRDAIRDAVSTEKPTPKSENMSE